MRRPEQQALPWRDYLNDDERQIIDRAETAKVEWQKLNAARAGIVNRAIQRAKYDLRASGARTTGGRDGER